MTGFLRAMVSASQTVMKEFSDGKVSEGEGEILFGIRLTRT